jgi:hypothetical protein
MTGDLPYRVFAETVTPDLVVCHWWRTRFGIEIAIEIGIDRVLDPDPDIDFDPGDPVTLIVNTQ